MQADGRCLEKRRELPSRVERSLAMAFCVEEVPSSNRGQDARDTSHRQSLRS